MICINCSDDASLFFVDVKDRLVVTSEWTPLCKRHSEQLILERSSLLSRNDLPIDDTSEIELRWLLNDSSTGQFEINFVDKSYTAELRIILGPCDGAALNHIVQNYSFPRPLTHQSCANIIAALGGRVDCACITRRYEKEGKQIYETFLTMTSNGETLNVDMRPSDAICIAFVTGAPLFVKNEIF